MDTEQINSFPSPMQLAKNVLDQAITSGQGMLHGKPLFASPEKAIARLKICEICEFYKETRCLKCGCYMQKKVHVEVTHCPAGKWGPELVSNISGSIPSVPSGLPQRPPVQIVHVN